MTWVCGYPCSRRSGGPDPPRTKWMGLPATVRVARSKASNTLRLLEENGSHERLRDGVRVVGVDGDRHRGRRLGLFAVNLAEILRHVTALGHPPAELRGARAHDHIRDRARFLALGDGAHGRRSVPHVADDARAHRFRKARPRHEDLRGLVVGGLLARVAALRQHHRLPRPLEHRRRLEIDLALDLFGHGRAFVGALHVQRLAAVVLDDGEVVLRAAPVLAFPSGRDALGARGRLRPVFDGDLVGRPCGGDGAQEQQKGESANADEVGHCAMITSAAMRAPVDSIRVDKWLWAARVFKTRSLASDACDGGKVDVNDTSVKPAKSVRPGDLIKVTLPQGRRRILKVVALSDRRGSASVAATLFEDLTPPEPPRVRLAPPPYRAPGAGRPTKRERRTMDRLRGW